MRLISRIFICLTLSGPAFSNMPVTVKSKLVEFEGVEKPLLGHVMESLTFGNNEDSFSVTRVYEWDESGSTFVDCGEIADLTEDRLKKIQKDDFVFVPFFTMEKTRVSMGTYQKVAAIVVGTQDESVGKKLHFAAQGGLVKKKEPASHKQDL